MVTYTESEVCRLMMQRARELGGPVALARACGVSYRYLRYVFRGTKPFGPKILGYLGLTKTVSYVATAEQPTKS